MLLMCYRCMLIRTIILHFVGWPWQQWGGQSADWWQRWQQQQQWQNWPSGASSSAPPCFPSQGSSQQACVQSLYHVGLAPMVRIFSHFLLFLVAFFWRFLLPCLVSLLLTTKVCVLLVLLLLAPIVILLALFGNGAELGVQLERPFRALRVAVITTIFSLSGDLAPQRPLVLSQSYLCLAEVTEASCVMTVNLQLRSCGWCRAWSCGRGPQGKCQRVCQWGRQLLHPLTRNGE